MSSSLLPIPTTSEMPSHHETDASPYQHFRLLDLPLELQRMIFDYSYKPWSLQIIDNYWRLSKSQYFCLDSYCRNPDYKASVLAGAPSPSLSMTCRHIYHQTEASMLKSFTGVLEVGIRSSHPTLPKLSTRFSKVYGLTKVLVMDERAFVDTFHPRDFPLLKELTISCFPIFCPDNFTGRTAPLNDEGFQDWAKKYQRLLERRSRKKLMNSDFVTVLDSQAEQWDSDESVFCYLAEEKSNIQVLREKLRLPGDEVDRTLEEDSLPGIEDDHVCIRLHRSGQATADDEDVEKST